MGPFELIKEHGEHEEIIFCHNKEVGLKAIIAIHDTTLGPALGGTRMWNYDTEEDALIDVLRLSKGMTLKASAAGLNLGGGKAVIIGDPKSEKSEGLFRAFGTFVNSLNGRYITAEDVGTTVQDMEYVFMETPYVTGIPEAFGGSGDPSPYTAHGVLMGIKAAAKHKLDRDDLAGLKVAVQGLGNVGKHLVKYLVREKAEVVVADIDDEKVNSICKEFGTSKVGKDEIVFQECDIFAPCAMGAIINEDTIGRLNCRIIAGGANNQLKINSHGDQLKEKGILYAPDFVINAGGLMNVFVELEGYSSDRAFDKTNQVYHNLIEVFKISDEEGVGTHTAAITLAERRRNMIGSLRTKLHGRTARPFSTLKEMTSRQK